MRPLTLSRTFCLNRLLLLYVFFACCASKRIHHANAMFVNSCPPSAACMCHWAVEFWEWINNSILHFLMSVITYPYGIIGSDNGLSPIRRQAIIWTNAGLWSIGPFSEISIKIQSFSFTKMYLKMSSVRWRPFYSRGDELILCGLVQLGHRYFRQGFSTDQTPSHLLNQWWFTVWWTVKNIFLWNLTQIQTSLWRQNISKCCLKIVFHVVHRNIS